MTIYSPIHSVSFKSIVNLSVKRDDLIDPFISGNKWRKLKYILADELFFENLPSVYERINEPTESVDVLYLTVCMDVFNASIAPGVSAAAYNGIFTDTAFMHFYKHILKSEKLVALDIAEVNPQFDIQERTARLAASLANEWLMI